MTPSALPRSRSCEVDRHSNPGAQILRFRTVRMRDQSPRNAAAARRQIENRPAVRFPSRPRRGQGSTLMGSVASAGTMGSTGNSRTMEHPSGRDLIVLKKRGTLRSKQ